MTKPHRLVAEIVAAAEGEIIGRVRLQKIVYLLEQKGLASGASFSYHHYGPFSRQIDEAVDAAKAFDGLEEVVRHRQSDGAPFSVFQLSPDSDVVPNGTIGGLSTDVVRDLIKRMKGKTSTVIELAATIHWLATREKVADWRLELKRRKGVKTANGRDDEALAVLRELELDPT